MKKDKPVYSVTPGKTVYKAMRRILSMSKMKKIGLILLDLIDATPPLKRRRRIASYRISSTYARRESVLLLSDPVLEEEEDLVVLDLVDTHPRLKHRKPPARSHRPSPVLKHGKPLHVLKHPLQVLQSIKLYNPSSSPSFASEIDDVQNFQQDTDGVDELQVVDELYGEREQRQLAVNEKNDYEIDGDSVDWTDSKEEGYSGDEGKLVPKAFKYVQNLIKDIGGYIVRSDDHRAEVVGPEMLEEKGVEEVVEELIKGEEEEGQLHSAWVVLDLVKEAVWVVTN
ncbi:hypothetical protein QJS04_geneDACA007981 [Acorus gramineus]|uniref:Uncharacterized protein n=1 Tax=Acorus gramineus TaxID=55184 RepID=A0AAV9BDQ7_ACOGR|nr:hypothetical protein QJS04_geneDACA007981 [Acorus gramineus]